MGHILFNNKTRFVDINAGDRLAGKGEGMKLAALPNGFAIVRSIDGCINLALASQLWRR
jgi:hypothetical protein